MGEQMTKQELPHRGRLFAISSAIALVCMIAGVGVSLADAPVSGAIFTTDSACIGTNVNIYGDKADVYLDGGPAHTGAAGLPDGYYYVQITGPEGTQLGTSVGSGNDTPVHVTGGEFDQCYQLAAILIKTSDSTPGYDDTPNPGGEYKVWVSTESSFTNSQTKTDNFKVTGQGGTPPQGVLNVKKFYDANANGVDDDGQPIEGWEIHITDEIDYGFFYTDSNGLISTVVAPDLYIITESTPVESNWHHTTPNPVEKTVEDGGEESVEFGNLCTGAGGGLTLGFWSNKNGEKLFNVGTDLTLMKELNLVDAKGKAFDPASYAKFRSWLLEATATNMAYMLSAQLAAMELNVLNGNVSGSSLIYAPGTTSANAAGFATVNAVMAEANTELGLNPLTLSGHASRSYQEALKNALDKANNNLNFVQGAPCPFSFAP
jgi:hypothetical protein